MPLVSLKRVWTPLALVGIQLLKDNEGYYYIRKKGTRLKKLT